MRPVSAAAKGFPPHFELHLSVTGTNSECALHVELHVDDRVSASQVLWCALERGCRVKSHQEAKVHGSDQWQIFSLSQTKSPIMLSMWGCTGLNVKLWLFH